MKDDKKNAKNDDWLLESVPVFKRKRHGRRGNIEGLTKHLVKKWGGDPHFFTKCMLDDELIDQYGTTGWGARHRKEICARAHKIATGIYPGEHRGKNPYGAKELSDDVRGDLRDFIRENALSYKQGKEIVSSKKWRCR